MPLSIPAAGVPYVRVDPGTVAESIATAPDGSAVASRLPLIPQILTKPAEVVDAGELRIYKGQELSIATARNDRGVWEIVKILQSGLAFDELLEMLGLTKPKE